MEMAPPCMEDVFCQQDETALSIRKYAHLWNGERIIWEQGNQSDPVVLPLERKYCSNWPNIVGFFFQNGSCKIIFVGNRDGTGSRRRRLSWSKRTKEGSGCIFGRQDDGEVRSKRKLMAILDMEKTSR